MLVTIIADASYCQETKVAGYGYWVASTRGKKGGGGRMKKTVVNNVVAEMQAVCNALAEGIRAGLVQDSDALIVQTDCRPAIEAFTGQRRRLIEEERACVMAFRKFSTRLRLKWEFRHVKGHTSRKEARYVTNNLCDKRAKEAMREAREQFRAGLIESPVIG